MPPCRLDLMTAAPGCALFIHVRDILTVSRMGIWQRQGEEGERAAQLGDGLPAEVEPEVPAQPSPRACRGFPGTTLGAHPNRLYFLGGEHERARSRAQLPDYAEDLSGRRPGQTAGA